MLGEAAPSAEVALTALCDRADDPATITTTAIFGAPTSAASLRELAERSTAITFDHELVDLEVIESLERDGIVFRPSSSALRFSVDKGFQRTEFVAHGLPVPRFVVTSDGVDPDVEGFLESLPEPPVVKAARGGYDGRGVNFPHSTDEARAMIREMSRFGDVVVEERQHLLGEIAHIVVRGVDGTLVSYPPVTTTQVDGMCTETIMPARCTPEIAHDVERHSQAIAELVGAIGICAVEYFLTPAGVVINEIALRPHNTGHWSIEGTTHSQFENHLRAVSGRPPLSPEVLFEHSVMVNLVGGAAPSSLARAEEIEGAHVHDYQKEWRPGRKLGHVTVCGADADLAYVRAWESAVAYGSKGAQ
jgi:5-(carboxyamino)imidazole ribonucleotide synthase